MTSTKAEELNERGREFAAKDRHAEAEHAYREAAAADPTWSVPWYNLGLMQKYRGIWDVSMECNLRATALNPSDEAAWWNLGIAATALGRWEEARRAWRACGISVPEGDGPIEMKLGHGPIRLAGGEVVWCTRIDPARAVLLNIPLPDSGHRWRDLVLHDGAANGHRKLRGVDVPVFDELDCLQRSIFTTFVVEVNAELAAIDSLSEIADEMGGAAEDWSTNTMVLCKECSEGTPSHLHDVDHANAAHPHVGLAARDEPHAREILSAWNARWADSYVHRLTAVAAAEPGAAANAGGIQRGLES